MLRSELMQDYDGYSGLLGSEILSHSVWNRQPEDTYHAELGATIMRGLREGKLDPEYYMKFLRGPHNAWEHVANHIIREAGYFDSDFFVDFEHARVSPWRYIDGVNVSVFADPNVAGRYHFGVLPAATEDQPYRSIGSYMVDEGQYDDPQRFRKHDVDFVARPFVELYDEIRYLPRFDITQCPVLELQQDKDGKLYFLQYLKTGQEMNPVDPFDLPSSDTTLRTTNVRGATPEDGRPMRLYLTPSRITEGMEGQGIFCGIITPRGIGVQLAAAKAGLIVHEAYVTFQNNHFNASPLYRPPIAMGLMECDPSPQTAIDKVQAVLDEMMDRRLSFSSEVLGYLDVHVTSNGREATLESDWQIKTTTYEDVS